MFDFLFFSDGCEGTEEIGRFPHRPGSSGVGPIIASSVFGDGPNVGKKPYDPYRMFAFIVLAFSLKKMTLRDIESTTFRKSWSAG